jgi:hypothetical protein
MLTRFLTGTPPYRTHPRACGSCGGTKWPVRPARCTAHPLLHGWMTRRFC